MWSVPFAGATAERGAEFILPHDTELIELARRLELRLVRKGTLYGNREPRGGEPVSGDEIAAAMEQLSALPEIQGETVYGALSRAGCESGVADAIAARLEVSCAYGADDLDASVLREGAGAFGDFPTHTVQGGNDRIARRLAAGLGDTVHLSSPVRWIRWTQREMKVHTDDAEARADAVVVAVPASVVEEIKFEPPLGEQKVDAHRSVRYGQAAKLFVPLRAPAPPSQVLSVPGRWWCYTQLRRRRRAVAVRRGVRREPARDRGAGPRQRPWAMGRRSRAAAAGPRARLRRGDDLNLGPGPVGARGVLGTLGCVVDREPGAQPARRPGGVRRRAHGGPLARADGRRAPERPAGRSGAAWNSCARLVRRVHDQNVAVRVV